jgi:hypothetical protein
MESLKSQIERLPYVAAELHARGELFGHTGRMLEQLEALTSGQIAELARALVIRGNKPAMRIQQRIESLCQTAVVCHAINH